MQCVRTIQIVKWKFVVLFMISLLVAMNTLLNVSVAFCVPRTLIEPFFKQCHKHHLLISAVEHYCIFNQQIVFGTRVLHSRGWCATSLL